LVPIFYLDSHACLEYTLQNYFHETQQIIVQLL
jgi:hypothetical protein